MGSAVKTAVLATVAALLVGCSVGADNGDTSAASREVEKAKSVGGATANPNLPLPSAGGTKPAGDQGVGGGNKFKLGKAGG